MRNNSNSTIFEPKTLAFAGGIFVTLLILYLLTLSNNYSPDGMAFSLLTTKAEVSNLLLFQAEHLFYPAAGWVWYKLWVLLGYGQGALVPLQTLNALFGAAGALFLFLALHTVLGRSQKSLFLSAVITLIFAVSYGYWFHSTEAEDQIIANAFALASFLILVLRFKNPSPYQIPILALTMSLAVLFHATHVLFVPALVLGLWLARPKLRDPFLFGGLSLLLVLIPYLVIGLGIHGFNSVDEFRAWLQSAPSVGVWGKLGFHNFWQGAKTLINGIVYLGGGPDFRALLMRADWRNFLGVAVFLVVAVGILNSLAHAIYHRHRVASNKISPVALLWTGAHTLFNFYWAPEDVQFWTAVLPGLAVILALASLDFVERYRTADRLYGVAGLLVLAILFTINLNQAMLPRHDLTSNDGYAKALCVADGTTENDLVIAPGWGWAANYLPYFGDREVFSIVDTYLLAARKDRTELFNQMRKRVIETKSQGGNVYIARLFSLSDEDLKWFDGVTSLTPDDFSFNKRLAWYCRDEPIWVVE